MNVNSRSLIQDKIAAICQMKHVKHAKARTALSPSLNKVFYNLLQLLKHTAMFLSVCTWIRDSSQVSLTNKPHNDFKKQTKKPHNICHLGTFSIGLHLELAPGHMYTAWEWIKAVLTCLLKHLLSSYFFPADKWMKTLFTCHSNPGTRYQRDLNLCNKLRSTLKHLLAAASEVQALSCLWCKATSGSHF